MIYIVNGAPGSGKTLFEDKVIQLMGNTAERVSTVDYVKYAAGLLGWDGTKTPDNRRFLSNLKQLLKDWNDIPFQKTQVTIKDIEADFRARKLDSDKTAIFIDSREAEEIERFVELNKARTVLIRRDSAESCQQSNASDANVFEYDNYDIVIDNNGTIQDLNQRALEFIESEHLYTDNDNLYIDIFGNIK